MYKKWLPYLLLAIMAIAVIGVRQCRNDDAGKKKIINQNSRNRDRGFDRRISFLEYTQHASCRMQCRHITRAEVEQIMKEGKINYRKSDVNQPPCPVYAVEGKTSDNQRVRIVFAQCDKKTKVVTVIDLDEEWTCHCPGDDRGSTSSPYNNNNP